MAGELQDGNGVVIQVEIRTTIVIRAQEVVSRKEALARLLLPNYSVLLPLRSDV